MTLLETRGLSVTFRGGEVARGPVRRRAPRGRDVAALDDVSLTVDPGSTLGVVGESGSGKSTLARALLGLIPVTSGEVLYRGEAVGAMDRRALRRFRTRAQLVFQDPAASMHPRLSIGAMLDEAVAVAGGLRGAAVPRRRTELLERVGLAPAEVSDALPHQVSGGQRQRACIARALAAEPELLILDEPTSALDVSVQASIVNLLLELREAFGLTSVFISHDLALVRLLADRVIILHGGRIVESGDTGTVLTAPSHDRTRRLLNASLGERVE